MSGIAVTLELKGKNVFLAGERVQGTWFVNVNSAVPVKVNFVTTYLIGATYVEWRETNYLRKDYKDDEFKAHELYTRQVTSHPVNGHGKQLAPGYYKYPFDYYIPKDKMHSSFEGHHGATRWFIKIEIGRPMPYSNIVKYKCFTYLANVDIDLPLYAGKQLKWNNQKLTIDPVPPTSLPRSSYCIKCSYYIEIKIPLPCYNEDIKLWFPITIGTVPQNHKNRQNEQSPPSLDGLNIPGRNRKENIGRDIQHHLGIQMTDLSNSITYREQKMSKSCFEYSSKTLEFPNILYTPLTAYVEEYTTTASGTTPSKSSLEKS